MIFSKLFSSCLQNFCFAFVCYTLDIRLWVCDSLAFVNTLIRSLLRIVLY